MQLTPGTSWQWQLGGGKLDETVLDNVDNTEKIYDIDLFNNDAATIARLHAKNITVICYMETGAWRATDPTPPSIRGACSGTVSRVTRKNASSIYVRSTSCYRSSPHGSISPCRRAAMGSSPTSTTPTTGMRPAFS